MSVTIKLEETAVVATLALLLATANTELAYLALVQHG